jgi:hypothetical protein
VRYGSIPFDTPECNAYVERCHGLCNQFFWSRHHFATVPDVRKPYPDFLRQIRHDYEVPEHPGMTPAQLRQQLSEHRVHLVNPDWHWTEGGDVPLVAGTVHCVRLTDTQARLSAFGRSFALDTDYRHSYVRATLSVAEQCLRFFFQESEVDDPQLIAAQPFDLPDPIHTYDPDLAETLLL